MLTRVSNIIAYDGTNINNEEKIILNEKNTKTYSVL